MDVLGAALHQADEDVGDEARADAVGDRVGERHDREGQERGNGDAPVGPIDVDHVAGHQEAHDHHGRGHGFEGHHVHERGEEHGREEQHAGDHVGQTGTRALGDTRGGLHEDLVRGHGTGTAGHRAQRVHEQHAVHAFDPPVLVHETRLLGQAHHGAHGVEEDGEQDCEDQQGARDHAELTERVDGRGRADQGEVRQGEETLGVGGHHEGPAVGVLGRGTRG